MIQIIYEKRWQLVALCILIRIIQIILNKKDIELLKSKHQIIYYSKVLYLRGIRKYLTITYMYFTIRMISMIFIKSTYVTIIEYIFVAILLSIFIRRLKRNYIVSIDNKTVNKDLPIVINKVIVLILALGFTLYSSNYFSDIMKNQSKLSMKVSDYQYQISKNEYGFKTIEVSLGKDNYMMSEINERNLEHINKFLSFTESIIKQKIIKEYFTAILIFLVLILISQIKIKNLKLQISSYTAELSLIMIIISSTIILDTSINDKKENINIYFHKYVAELESIYLSK